MFFTQKSIKNSAELYKANKRTRRECLGFWPRVVPPGHGGPKARHGQCGAARGKTPNIFDGWAIGVLRRSRWGFCFKKGFDLNWMIFFHISLLKFYKKYLSNFTHLRSEFVQSKWAPALLNFAVIEFNSFSRRYLSA